MRRRIKQADQYPGQRWVRALATFLSDMVRVAAALVILIALVGWIIGWRLAPMPFAPLFKGSAGTTPSLQVPGFDPTGSALYATRHYERDPRYAAKWDGRFITFINATGLKPPLLGGQQVPRGSLRI